MDVVGSMTAEEITSELQLDKIEDREWKIV